ncbi:D-2-hydroxyacid dehydrogenase family protein [Compostimonas suwonensis]|uniref:Lactate dehydrogenase-like 2-hydroxyacid dehydrogenase n=1 Tax=Compostimonas suwonensis TaxID=1048394 RepID=A0A2M9BCX5_9MICO|nr:D-2-hydroxyacid dehydrogenase family protein [Compostimonas suwonensis]PJJ55790.1 lactate dehydrogenase-like 2-hydroxyacid dehydrogenase [Compostimonas suwonensis]
MDRPEEFAVAVLDDYQDVALTSADWSPLDGRAAVTVLNRHIGDEHELVAALQGFDAVCVMRERTPLPRRVLERLPRLRLICSTGRSNASIDLAAAAGLGIEVANTGAAGQGPLELSWALLLAAVRRLPVELGSLRAGGWQQTVGGDLAGSTIGLLGLGRIGGQMAAVANAFGMEVIAWSPHLDEQAARERGARFVDKATLFRESDVVSIHLVLAESTRGIVGRTELESMKPTAYLVNTSRGPLVDEAALIEVLERRAIAGAALDVYDTEPLPAGHPFRTLDDVVATGHIGFVTQSSYRAFYGGTVANLVEWLDRA